MRGQTRLPPGWRKNWGSVLGEIVAAIWADSLMARWVGLIRQKFQIFWSVIISDAIQMVNDFARPQWAAKFLRHDETMLKDVAALIGSSIGPVV